MEITFRTASLRKTCNDAKALQQGYGMAGRKLIRRRLDDLEAAPNLETMRRLPGDCHELTGDLAGLLAISLHAGFRLIFQAGDDPSPTKADGGLDWSAVTKIQIERIEDYHG